MLARFFYANAEWLVAKCFRKCLAVDRIAFEHDLALSKKNEEARLFAIALGNEQRIIANDPFHVNEPMPERYVVSVTRVFVAKELAVTQGRI